MTTRRGFLKTSLTGLGGLLIHRAFPAVLLHGRTPTTGQWDPPITWPIEGVHLILLPTGKVLTFRRTFYTNPNTKAYIWDPANPGVFVEAPAPPTVPTFPCSGQSVDSIPNLFCCGHCHLADGRVLFNGGSGSGEDPGDETKGIKITLTFDPFTQTWRREADMAFARWYPSVITLGDGRVVTVGGDDQCDALVDEVEVFTPYTGWQTLTDPTPQLRNYPRLHLIPNGRVFHSGRERPTYALNVTTSQWTLIDQTNFGPRADGTGLLLPQIGKVMTIGGSHYGYTAPATRTCEVIDFSVTPPAWQDTGLMASPRKHANAVLLPDGKVAVIGGTEWGNDEMPTKYTELYDQNAGSFTQDALQGEVRGYHSTALLLPDGRVLSAGSNGNFWAELYSPPYLFAGARPVISSVVPSEFGYGATFQVTMNNSDAISNVILMRPGSVTHSLNFDQRRVTLSFVQSVDQLTVQMITNRNVAPPGWYMLFVLNTSSVPSVGWWVKVLQ